MLGAGKRVDDIWRFMYFSMQGEPTGMAKSSSLSCRLRMSQESPTSGCTKVGRQQGVKETSAAHFAALQMAPDIQEKTLQRYPLHLQPVWQETFPLQPNTWWSFIWMQPLSHSLTAGDENPQICPKSSVPDHVGKDNCLVRKEQPIGLWLLTLSAAEGSADGGAYV